MSDNWIYEDSAMGRSLRTWNEIHDTQIKITESFAPPPASPAPAPTVIGSMPRAYPDLDLSIKPKIPRREMKPRKGMMARLRALITRLLLRSATRQRAARLLANDERD